MLQQELVRDFCLRPFHATSYLLNEFGDIVDLVVNNDPQVVSGVVLGDFVEGVDCGRHCSKSWGCNKVKESKRTDQAPDHIFQHASHGPKSP